MKEIMPNPPLLHVSNLGVRFTTDELCFDAVSGVSFSIGEGEIFCLVGESGCGKSLTAKALLRLTPENATLTGRALLRPRSAEADASSRASVDLLTLAPRAIRALRGRAMGMIFQEPMTALNPVLRVGEQVAESLRLHLRLNKSQARLRCVELFQQVGIPSPESRLDDYPHQLSGGMRQRVMIAMALACEPLLLLADEPTTALDVTIQWQILQLIRTLAMERGMGVLLITHDLGVVAQVAQHVGVMYAGQLVECGAVDALLRNPLHPYTKGLLHSAPGRHSMGQERLSVIPGSVPPPGHLPAGCRFHPRCAQALPRCQHQAPELQNHHEAQDNAKSPIRQVRCWLY